MANISVSEAMQRVEETLNAAVRAIDQDKQRAERIRGNWATISIVSEEKANREHALECT
jgi:hypothetical protein